MEPQQRQPWNKGKLVGQKALLKLRDIWAIRIRLQLRHRTRDLALFNLAIDSKPRALVKLRVLDVAHGGQVAPRVLKSSHSRDCSRSLRTGRVTQQCVPSLSTAMLTP